MKKVIFLDIDGVLNAGVQNGNQQMEWSDGSLIDEEKVELLKQIVERTGASIILHSGWRFWFDEGLRPTREEAERLVGILGNYGIRIWDVTPDFSTEEIKKSKKFSLVKAKEILHWLKEHQEVENWLVIDDLELHNEEVAKHLVRTDQTVGLTEADVELAVRMLGDFA